jgi:hypothetical protein
VTNGNPGRDPPDEGNNDAHPQQFVQKWHGTTLRERQMYQIHFMDVWL